MKKRQLIIICCFVGMMILGGCQNKAGKETTTPKSTEVVTSETAKQTEASTEGAEVTEAITTEMPKVTEPAATEVPQQTEAAYTEILKETEADTSAVWEETNNETVSGEEMMQCPYCAYWFSAVQDGDSLSPYDLHMEEERANDLSNGETEEEMVQCPDCGNWYEAGNVFRNHACTGR